MNPLKDTNFADSLNIFIVAITIITIVKIIIAFLSKFYGI